MASHRVINWYTLVPFLKAGTIGQVLLLMGSACFAQFTDNFSDGNFTADPAWTPDDPQNWVIDNGRLRSNSATSNSSFWISTPSAKATNAQWEFFINLQFNTSSANYVDVYLTSANQNLSAPGNNGYFVRIGGTPDEVSLFKMVSGTPTLLINGTDGVTNFSNNILRIKVVRDIHHLWTLFYDNTGTGTNYFDEPPVTDNTFTTSNFFGLRVQSTSTFFNRHYFDDFYAGDIIQDTEPPVIISATAVSANTLYVTFNEKVEAASSQNMLNYSVNNGIGHPVTAVLQPDQRTVQLTFANAFPNGITCRLTAVHVQDLNDNAIVSATLDFFFFQPMPVSNKDVIFTELLADPNPVVGLPEAEFVELYNRSTNPVNLAGWKFADQSSTATLPAFILLPHTYVIVTATGSASLFSAFGPVLGVSNFPTLNNSGDNLVLRDPSNLVIDEVNYTDGWYKNDDKKQGGWTLELIDLQNTCAEEENWVASENPAGGTPGQVNSVNANKPDLTGPKLLSAVPVTAARLKLRFNEKLEGTLPVPQSFLITPLVTVTAVSFVSAALRELQLELSAAIQPQQTYSITVSNVFDCSGNPVEAPFNTVQFGFPEAAAPLDIVVNELLFNPKPFGVDFVEILNRSEKYINLKNFSIGNFENGNALNLKTITTDDLLLPPHGIMAFTPDPFTIVSHYPRAQDGRIVNVNSLPSLPDNEGTVSVVNDGAVVLDNFWYTRDYHSVFLRDKEGVSLERIHADFPTNDPNNWKSGASTVGFATPGLPNSNSPAASSGTGEVKIEPELFIPLFGQPDFTEIRYRFDRGGKVANIKILDQQGREIKRIANNETLATEGFYRWDGDRDDGIKARPGYYLVWFEVFDTTGVVETFRKRVVVAVRH